MKVMRKKLAMIIGERTLTVRDTKQLGREVAAYLLAEGRVAELDSIMRDVLVFRASQGVVEATVKTAHPVSAAILQDVEQLVKTQYPHAKQVIVREQHDANLIGGLKIDLPDEQLDLSVRATLDTFKRLTTGRTS